MIYSYGPLQRNIPVFSDQQKLIFISSVQTLDAVWRIYLYWPIGVYTHTHTHTERERERERESSRNPRCRHPLMMAVGIFQPFLLILFSEINDLLTASKRMQAIFIKLFWTRESDQQKIKCEVWSVNNSFQIFNNLLISETLLVCEFSYFYKNYSEKA